jgi:hypothetical protein
MSQDFQKVLVKDDRLMVTDAVRYAVIKGGANMTCAQYPAIGSGPFSSNINFNIQVPSQETVVSRQVLLRTTLNFTISGTPAAVAGYTGPGSGWLFNYGGVDGFGPFPFHQLVNSTQWTINNNTISQNTRDILATLCRIHDKRYLHRYNGMTPTMFDSYGDYTTIPKGALNNPFGGFQRMSMDNDLAPRGVLPATITATTGVNYGTAGAAAVVTVSILVTEPVLISPFIFAGDEGQGIYGIQNLNAVYNLSSSLNTCIRFANVAGRYTVAPTVTFQGASDPTLLFQFLTPHPSDLLPSRNVVPYYELPRFVSSVGSVATGITSTITSSSLQLNQIPDKIYISVGKQVDNRLNTDADAFLAIQSISINWNNSSGLLASATPQDLWRMSVENGINMSWVEWSGQANVQPTDITQATIQTCGSILCLEFGKDIELKDDYYAPGSLGNFQLQFTVRTLNTSASTIANLQLLTIVQNSGVFSLERGVSSSYLGVLTKSDVLEASRGVAIPYSDALRMVGGSKVGDFFKTIGSKLGDAGKSLAKELLPLAKDAGVKLLKSKIGMGQSGGRRDMGALEDRMY